MLDFNDTYFMKDLFDQGPKKIIEGDYGEVEYVEDFLSYSEADSFFEILNSKYKCINNILNMNIVSSKIWLKYFYFFI